MTSRIVLEIELGLTGEPAPEPGPLPTAVPGVSLEVLDREGGNGFGVTEMVTIAITVGAAVSAELIADAIRAGLRGIVRRAGGATGERNGDVASLEELIKSELAASDKKESQDSKKPESNKKGKKGKKGKGEEGD